jgi:formimidoylglutamate deiminase
MSERIAAAASQTGIGLTLLPVFYQYGGCDKRPLGPGQVRFGNDISRFADLVDAAERALKHLPADARIGVAPHSLRAVAPEDLARAASLRPDAPLHMHLAEQVAEVEEVLAHRGARPVDWLLGNAEVDRRWCLIHCTQMLENETLSLAATGAVAGLCPITESSLGDGIFDGVRYLGAGGVIANLLILLHLMANPCIWRAVRATLHLTLGHLQAMTASCAMSGLQAVMSCVRGGTFVTRPSQPTTSVRCRG